MALASPLRADRGGRRRRAGKRGSDRLVAFQRLCQRWKRRRSERKYRSQAQRQRVAGISPQARQREIVAREKRKSRQEPRCADIGKKADTDLRHREDKALTRHPMRRVHRKTNTPAHNDAVHERDDRFWIGLDPPIELVFLPPEGQLRVMIARTAELVEAPDVSARAKRPLARAKKDNPANGADPPPIRRERPQSA